MEKLRLWVLLLGIVVIIPKQSDAQQTSYPMKFQFRNTNGVLRDTLMPRMRFRIWRQSNSFPTYVKWKGFPFSICNSPIDGLGLFSDSLSSFAQGSEIGFAFIKINNTGHFELDYQETNIGSFINDSQEPNMEVVLTSMGIIMKAKVNISPNTELTLNYREIIVLFPEDAGVVRSIKYW
jgi:hypothetical protein